MDQSLFTKVERLKLIIQTSVTGGAWYETEYRDLRNKIVSENSLKKYIPKFLINCRNLDDIWAFMKERFSKYQERREFIRDEFSEMLEFLEFNLENNNITQTVFNGVFQSEDDKEFYSYVLECWDKALARIKDDPEGAITTSRSLLESTFKHILMDSNVPYENLKLPKLHKEVSKVLNMSPDQHSEQVYKEILGGISQVVKALGEVRSKDGDSHGKVSTRAKPSSRHAKLTVHLAGSLCEFIIESYLEKKNK